MSGPALSIVIPAFNESTRLPRTLARLREYLQRSPGEWEILVVDDGSADDTAAQAPGTGVRLIRNDRNRGKGYSVRRGMRAARGERRLMCDADLSTPIEELPRLAQRLDEGYELAIASRAMAGAKIEIHQSHYRESMGRLFNVCVRAIALPALHDTQCGFKLFSAAAAEDIFSLARLDGFSFDVEALFIARKRGYRIAEVPVVWRNDSASRVRFGAGMLAFADLIRIRANDAAGRYRAPARAESLTAADPSR